MSCLAFRVRGRVQGVGYRAGVEALARRLPVSGWVANVSDGTVQGRVAGPPEAVDAFLAGLPDAALRGRVDEVETRAVGDLPDPGFRRGPTLDAPTPDWPA